jgi:uncharacterized protein (TIGR03067 family)
MKPLNRVRACVLAGVVLAGAVGCSKQSQPARPGLDGHWTGYEVRQPAAKCTVAIKGDQLEYRGAQPLDWLRGSFVLNEQAQPRQMDLSIKEAGDVNLNDVGTTALLIYELGGDELKVAVSSLDRPTDFAGGQGIHVFSFRRD